MQITRKNFLKSACMSMFGITTLSAIANADSIESKSNIITDEYARCKADPVYFIEKYFKVGHFEGTFNIKLRDYQKDYICRLANNNHLIVCNKCRQAGITSLNIAFALWKAAFDEKASVFIVEPNRLMASTVNSIISLNGDIINDFNVEGKIKAVDSRSFDVEHLDSNSNNVVILDELAFYSKAFDQTYIDMFSGRPKKIQKTIISSTPCRRDDLFSYLCTNVKMNLPDQYIELPGSLVFSKSKMNDFKTVLEDKQFKQEYLNEFI